MPEPPIKARLESPELTTALSPIVRQRLNSCLASDPAHIRPGDQGEHVAVIQDVLRSLRQRMPDLGLLDIQKDKRGEYGDDTRKAVKRYKEINAIVRKGQPLDDIVGRMTISSLDNDLLYGTSPKPITPVVMHAPVEIASSTPPENLSKDDLTFDFRAVPMATGNFDIFKFRRLSNQVLEEKMIHDLQMAEPRFGPMLARDFFANSTAPSPSFFITHGAGSPFSVFVTRTAVWAAHSMAFRTALDAHIKRLGVNGPFSPVALTNLVPAPVPSWSPQDLRDKARAGLSLLTGLRTEDGAMLAMIGTFQASRVFLADFSMDAGTRRYTGTLLFQLVDHFGVDTSDTIPDTRGHGTESQVAFWVLQHERHNPGHMPYRLRIIISEGIDGSF